VTTIEPPEEHHLPEGAHAARSIVLVNTGDGKGKSTAAFGVVMRGAARGWKVGVVQFLKSGEWHVGEEDIARRLGVEWWALGDGFTWDSENLTQDQAVAREAWARAKSLIQSGDYQLVVLDEITYPMTWGWIDTDDVVSTIRDRPAKVNVVATGRDAPAALIDVADTATEMRKIKHAYDAGHPREEGHRLLMTCPNCGVEINDNRRFCGKCGTEVSAPKAYRAPGSRRATEHLGHARQPGNVRTGADAS